MATTLQPAKISVTLDTGEAEDRLEELGREIEQAGSISTKELTKVSYLGIKSSRSNDEATESEVAFHKFQENYKRVTAAVYDPAKAAKELIQSKEAKANVLGAAGISTAITAVEGAAVAASLLPYMAYALEGFFASDTPVVSQIIDSIREKMVKISTFARTIGPAITQTLELDRAYLRLGGQVPTDQSAIFNQFRDLAQGKAELDARIDQKIYGEMVRKLGSQLGKAAGIGR